VKEIGFDHIGEDVGVRDSANGDGRAITTLTKCDSITGEEGDHTKEYALSKHLHY